MTERGTRHVDERYILAACDGIFNQRLQERVTASTWNRKAGDRLKLGLKIVMAWDTIMRRRATLVIDRKITLEDGTILQAIVWELPIPLKGSLHRYKYRLYCGLQGRCLVRFDNEQGKGDHKHVMGLEFPYLFLDIPTLLKDFRDEIKRAGGKI